MAHVTVELQRYHTKHRTWGFPKTAGTFLGVPISRILVFWGLYWGPPVLGNYHISSKMHFALLRAKL